MKKSTLLSLGLFTASVLGAGSAMAFIVDERHQVNEPINRMDVDVGEWHCDEGYLVEVADEVSPVFGIGYEACRHACKWVNYAFLPSSTRLVIDEIVRPDFPDCYENDDLAILTTIVLAPYEEVGASYGFDAFQMRRKVVGLIQGEAGDDPTNPTYGSIAFAYGGLFQWKPLETWIE